MDEPAGFQTAKINRTQRSNAQGGGAQPANQGGQSDPWGAPTTAGSNSGWGNGPEQSEPPF